MKKTFTTTFVLFVAWNLLVVRLPDQRRPSHTLWNGNLIAAESVLFDVDKLVDKTVVLGSSCAAGLSFDSKVVNLSLAGLSIYDGEMVLSKRNDRPRTVWIEANVIQRPPSDDFARMFNATSHLRGILPGMRTQNQPVAVAERFYDWARPRLKAAVLRLPMVTDVSHASAEPKIDPSWLSDLQRDRAHAINPNELKLSIERLRNLIEPLEGDGVKIAFFEMPQHPSLCESPLVQSIRVAVKTAFPNVPYLDRPNCDDYSTSDGIHLTKASAITYVKYLTSGMGAWPDH